MYNSCIWTKKPSAYKYSVSNITSNNILIITPRGTHFWSITKNSQEMAGLRMYASWREGHQRILGKRQPENPSDLLLVDGGGLTGRVAAYLWASVVFKRQSGWDTWMEAQGSVMGWPNAASAAPEAHGQGGLPFTQAEFTGLISHSED